MSAPLSSRYDVGLFDLDGVCYLGNDSIPHAPEEVNRAVAGDFKNAYVTNNASRPREDVAQQLRGMGFPATAATVLTSAEIAVDMTLRLFGEDATALIIGGPGLRKAARNASLTAVESADDRPDVVLQGFSPDVGWPELSEAALAIRAGATYIATNLDKTIPRERGLMVGNGSLVTAVAVSTGATPLSAGKPEPEIFRAAAALMEAERPLAIGDNLDTDIKGAVAAGIDSMHVLTGLASARDICLAPSDVRPTYLCDDMRGLNEPYPEAAVEGARARVGEAFAEWTGQGFDVTDAGEAVDVSNGASLALDAYRALVLAAWRAADAGSDVSRSIGELRVVRL